MGKTILTWHYRLLRLGDTANYWWLAFLLWRMQTSQQDNSNYME